jgi:Na+-translocating ferredoxin:NAD+ oxidoreductase RnfE subunit
MTGTSNPIPIEDGLMLLFLGLCPAIAVSVRVIDAIWMSVGVILVLVLSGLAVALLSGEGEAEPKSRRMPALVVAAFLTAAFEAGLLAFAPTASAGLGIYAPLIAVNCLVLGGGTPGSSPRTLVASLREALGRGARFAAALVLIALVRESLGAGTITLFSVGGFQGIIEIPGLAEQPVRALGLAGGGLLCLGYLAGAARAISRRAAARSSSTGAMR